MMKMSVSWIGRRGSRTRVVIWIRSGAGAVMVAMALRRLARSEVGAAQIEVPDQRIVGLAPADGEGGDKLAGVVADDQRFIDMVIEGMRGALVDGVRVEGEGVACAHPHERALGTDG